MPMGIYQYRSCLFEIIWAMIDNYVVAIYLSLDKFQYLK